MSATQMTTDNALTLKLWASKDWVNMGQKSVFGQLYKRGAIFYAKDFEGMKKKGDQITYDYVGKLVGIPVGEGGTLDGNEESLDLGAFTMAINTTRIGVLNPNDDTIEQQRTLVDFPEKTRMLIPARHKELMDASCFNHLAGFNPTSYTQNGTTWTGVNKLFVQGHNTPVAPSTDRIIRAGAQATDQALTSSNKFTLDLIDYALEKAMNSDQPLEMFEDDTFDLYISLEQMTDLKHDASAAITWFNINLAQLEGGKSSKIEDQLYQGILCQGKYANVNIYAHPRVAYGQNSSTSAVITTVRRAVLVGKNALTYASPFGAPEKESALRYAEQLKDYGYYKGLEGRAIYGVKKTVASNSEDIGAFVISTYAAAHA